MDRPDLDQPDLDESHVDQPDLDESDLDEPDVDQPGASPRPATWRRDRDGDVGLRPRSVVQSLPQGAIMQMLVSKVSSVPGTHTCDSETQVILQPVANVTSLNGAANTSFSLAPGEQAVVTVRVACNAATAPATRRGRTPRWCSPSRRRTARRVPSW